MPMNENLALALLGGFLLLMVVGMVLLVVAQRKRHLQLLACWQSLADQRGWRFAHQNRNPHWTLESSRWTVLHEDSPTDSLPDRVVFRAAVQTPEKLLVVQRKQWNQWQKRLNLPHQQLRERDLRWQGVEGLDGFADRLREVQVPGWPAEMVVLASHPQFALKVLERLGPRLQDSKPTLHLLLHNKTLVLQANGMEMQADQVLPLVALGEAVLDRLGS